MPAYPSWTDRLDLDLDLPARIEETGEHGRVRRSHVAEDLGMGTCEPVEVIRVHEVDARAHDVGEARTRLLERRADELEAHVRLVVDVVRRRRAVGRIRGSARHVHA